MTGLPAQALVLRARAALVLLLSIALGAALLPVAPSHAEDEHTVEIAPAIAGNTAVRWNQAVTVNGEVPDGVITSARLVALDLGEENGLAQVIPGYIRNTPPPDPITDLITDDDYLHNDGGDLSGRLTLFGCQWSPPLPAAGGCEHDTDALYLEVTIDHGAPILSAPLRVDYTRPTFGARALVQENRILVRFSEPVRLTGPDLPTDWEVTDPDTEVLAVEGPTEGDCVVPGRTEKEAAKGDTGCTRTLVLGGVLDEDDSPTVAFPFSDYLVPTRQPHTDYASNQMIFSGTAIMEAVDRIRPPTPRIHSLDDSEPEGSPPTVVGGSVAPTAVVGNLREGHRVTFKVTGPDGVAEEVEADQVVVPSDGTHTFALPPVTDAEEITDAFVIEAVVRDPEGNRSDDLELNAPSALLTPGRSDQSPSAVVYGLYTALPTPPAVTVPSDTVHVSAAAYEISGTAPSGLVVEVVRHGEDDALATTTAVDGRWAVEVPLDADGRHDFAARTRFSGTEIRSADVPVSTIVRDTRPPQVDVTEPSLRSGLPFTERRPKIAVGSDVAVEWTASDPAPGGDDHGERVDIDLLLGEDEERTIASHLDYVAGETQSFTYTLTEEDRAAQGSDGIAFRVRVSDRAGNVGRDVSARVLVVGDLIDFVPVTTRTSTAQITPDGQIEVRFDEALLGSTSAADWRVDGTPPAAASMTERDGRTVVVLDVTGLTDPNATPSVAYDESLLGSLRGPDGFTELVSAPIVARDGIAPALALTRRPAEQPRSLTAVTVAGDTDETSRPNAVHVFLADAAGEPTGPPVASTTAATDGSFELDVPVPPNADTRFAVRATDPADNVSSVEGFRVVEDSLAPVVTITRPAHAARVSDRVELRWRTVDLHPDVVDIDLRVDDGPWRALAAQIADQGRFDWEIGDDIADTAALTFRITAVDQARNTGSAQRTVYMPDATIPGTPPPGDDGPIDPGPGVDLLTAIATSERTIDLRFTEPVLTDSGPAGFSIVAGPGVERVSGTGRERTLHLNADLSTTSPLVSYTGRGVRFLDGRPLPAARVRAERGFAFAPEGLGGHSRDGVVRLSWTDERNHPGDVVRYEVRRGDALIASTDPADRFHLDGQAGAGVVSYSVTTVDDLGHVSTAATVTIDPNAPNITPSGGFVLSEDGRLAITVPPGAVSKDYHGRLVARPAVDGRYRAIVDSYELSATAADDGASLDAFERYASLSFRPGSGLLGSRTAERVAGLRVLDGGLDELSTRVGHASSESPFLTLGTFGLGESTGATTRVAGPDPALTRNRFATAAGLSQATFGGAGTAVIARADDYPDALASATLAAQVGGPVLLATTEQMPPATVLELQRLGVERVVLVGGEAALNRSVQDQAVAMGLATERVFGSNRFETAVAIAGRTGAFEGQAYLATGQNFADALAASGPSALLTRPILLTATGSLPHATLDGLRSAGITSVTILGGDAAIAPVVADRLQAEGFATSRIFGAERFATSVALAEALQADGLTWRRPIAASGQGDGRTSPDALAAGPTAARFGSPTLLVPRDRIAGSVEQAVAAAAGIRGIVVAGGTAAVSDTTRDHLDAALR